jgi:uncharacterized protein YbjT (DUF2867 family)
MIVVAGASGKTGRGVVEALLAAGRKVRVLVRRAEAGESFRRRGLDVQVVELADTVGLEHALRGATAFYALVPEEPAAEHFTGRRRTIVHSLELAIGRAEVAHVVLLSAAAAVLSCNNGPAAELRLAEQELSGVAPTLTVLRATYFQENLLASLSAARRSGVYLNFLPPGGARVPMVATRDVAELAASCLLEPPRQRVIDVLGPSYSPVMVAERLSVLLGRELPVVDVAPERCEVALLELGLPSAYACALAELYGCFARGEVAAEGERTVYGATTLEQTLAQAHPDASTETRPLPREQGVQP